MQKLKMISGSTAALFVALLFVTAVPALAHEGEDHTSGSNSGSGSSSSRTSDDSVKTTTVTTDDVNDDSTSRNRGSGSTKTLRAASDAKQAKSEAKALQNSDKRKKVCVARTHGLENKFSRIITNSEKHHERISSILTKAVAYQKEHNVAVDNFDQLVADASTKSAAAQDAITNLKAVEPKIDCNNNGQVAALVGTFKTQAQATRDSLKAYKQSVKAVLQALIKAKESTEEDKPTTTTDDSTNTEGSN